MAVVIIQTRRRVPRPRLGPRIVSVRRDDWIRLAETRDLSFRKIETHPISKNIHSFRTSLLEGYRKYVASVLFDGIIHLVITFLFVFSRNENRTWNIERIPVDIVPYVPYTNTEESLN